MNLEEAKALKRGQIIYHKWCINADKTPQRFRVTGKVKTWKRDFTRFKVPLKRGLYEYGYLEPYNLDDFSLTEEGAIHQTHR